MENKAQDPYRFKEATQTGADAQLRVDLQAYFQRSPGSSIEKLYNFAKYVRRATLTRFLSRVEIFKQVLEVQGSVIDCGVLFGQSLMTWAKVSAIYEPLNSQRKIVGFDTFQGFPALSDKDKTGKAAESKAGGFDFGETDIYRDLEECIKVYDQDRQIGHIPKVEIVKGDICKTIPEYLRANPHTIVSLLHLDVDIYEPTKAALHHFVPRMPKGAVIVFDELNSNLWPGESIALLDEIGVKNLRIKRFPWDSYISYAVL
jgi:hypothetical protein